MPARRSASRRDPAPRALAAGLFALVIGGTATLAGAAEPRGVRVGGVQLRPTVGVELGYDDNVLVDAADPVADGVARLVGRLELGSAPPSRSSPPPPVDAVAAIDAARAFPHDVLDRVGAPPPVPRLPRTHRGVLWDVGAQADGVLFASEDQLNNLDASYFGAAGLAGGGGWRVGGAGEWVDRTTATDDLEDVAAYAADLRLAGVDFDRGAAGATLGYVRPGGRWEVEAGYAYFLARFDDEPFDLFGFDFHQAGLEGTWRSPTGLEAVLRYDVAVVDGDADAAALRRAGLVPAAVVLAFTEDPREAVAHQGSLRVQVPLGARWLASARVGAQARDFADPALEGYVDLLAEGELRWTPRDEVVARVEVDRLPIDAFGEDGAFFVRERLRGALSWTVARAWTLAASVDGGRDTFDRESSLTGEERRDEFAGGEASVTWRSPASLSLELRYRGRTRSSSASTESSTRHRVGLRALYRY